MGDTTVQNAENAQQKTKQKKKSVHKTINRNKTVFESSRNALLDLKAAGIETIIRDKDIVKKDMDLIQELRKSGVPVKSIYETIKNAAQLQISLKTFEKYIYEAAPKRASKTQAPKTEQRPAPTPTPTAAEMKPIGGSEPNEAQKVMKGKLLKYMSTNAVKCSKCENGFKEEDIKTGGTKFFLMCPKCKTPVFLDSLNIPSK